MADNRKEQERAELHRTIWGIANELRGSVDGWDFKQYVLGMLFYMYISQNIRDYINDGEHQYGDTEFDYANISDADAETIREDIVNTRGLFVLPSQLFSNVLKNANEEDINTVLFDAFKAIERSAQGTSTDKNLENLFADVDVNSKKLGSTQKEINQRLIKIMQELDKLNLGNYKNNTIDAFGDAYEYLMGMYAANAGKSGGEYFTPQEVSQLLTRLGLGDKTHINKVYDPCCGSRVIIVLTANSNDGYRT